MLKRAFVLQSAKSGFFDHTCEIGMYLVWYYNYRKYDNPLKFLGTKIRKLTEQLMFITIKEVSLVKESSSAAGIEPRYAAVLCRSTCSSSRWSIIEYCRPLSAVVKESQHIVPFNFYKRKQTTCCSSPRTAGYSL